MDYWGKGDCGRCVEESRHQEWAIYSEISWRSCALLPMRNVTFFFWLVASGPVLLLMVSGFVCSYYRQGLTNETPGEWTLNCSPQKQNINLSRPVAAGGEDRGARRSRSSPWPHVFPGKKAMFLNFLFIPSPCAGCCWCKGPLLHPAFASIWAGCYTTWWLLHGHTDAWQDWLSRRMRTWGKVRWRFLLSLLW